MTAAIVLVWMFAVSAVSLGTVALITLALTIRHRYRRRKGVYVKIMAGNPSSKVTRILTVSDSLIDLSMHREMEKQLIERRTSLEERSAGQA